MRVVCYGGLLTECRPPNMYSRISCPTPNMEIPSSWTNLVLRQVVYEGLGPALTGSIAFLFLGPVEPTLGSSKLASLLVLTAAVSFVLFLPGMFILSSQDKVWNQKLVPSAGPLPVIFSLYSVYWLVIPVCRPYSYRILGMDFSEKAPIYLLGVQLFFFGGWHSIFPSVVGILCGAAWISNIREVQGVSIPFLKSLVNDWIGTHYPNPTYYVAAHGSCFAILSVDVSVLLENFCGFYHCYRMAYTLLCVVGLGSIFGVNFCARSPAPTLLPR